jgi:hypothetical protein
MKNFVNLSNDEIQILKDRETKLAWNVEYFSKELQAARVELAALRASLSLIEENNQTDNLMRL